LLIYAYDQVIVSKQLRALTVGRHRIQFIYQSLSLFNKVNQQDWLDKIKSEEGFAKVAGVELTLLDSMRYFHNVGGMNSAAQFEQRVVVRQIIDQPPRELVQGDTRPHIADIYRWLMNNEMRNRLIAADVAEQVAQNRHPLVLTERGEHALALSRMLAGQGFQVQVLRGAMRIKERREAIKAISGCQLFMVSRLVSSRIATWEFRLTIWMLP
jgi:hypothetical protein